MYCSKCGMQVADEAAFCSKCGSQIARIPETAAEQPKEIEVPKTSPAEVEEYAAYAREHEVGHQPQMAKTMLTRPEYGWTDFHLEGTSRYVLSYMDDIAFEWLDMAIQGLSMMKPFCVKGFMEPGRVLCTVSYWNCHILTENDASYELEQKDIELEYSHTNMLEFCQCLYNDVSMNIDQWASFSNRGIPSFVQFHKRKAALNSKLKTLGRLIDEKAPLFGPNRCFY